jgi:hypothetical protein
MCIHLLLIAIMEAVLMIIKKDKYNRLSYRVFISIIRQAKLYTSCILVFSILLRVSAVHFRYRQVGH